MNVGITTFCCDGGRSGIGQYVVNLLRALDETDTIPSLDIFAYRDETSIFACKHIDVAYHTLSGRWRNPLLGLAWYQTALPIRCRRAALDVLFVPEANRRLPVRVPCSTVGTVHDFSSFHMTQKYDLVREAYIKRALPRLIRRLDRIITVSESSKRDIVAFTGVPGDRVTVIPHGVDRTRYYPKPEHEKPPSLPGVGTKPYILYVSRIEHPGKNHVALAEAFARLIGRIGCDHQLVFAGSDWSRADEVREAVRRLGICERVTFTGYVAADQLPRLYRHCSMFVFPSLFEGFGMPILEAMASGVPVACSDTSSMPEVAGDAALLFTPTDVESIAGSMERLITDTSVRDESVRRGLDRCTAYTWAHTAARTVQTIQEAAQP